MFNKLKLIRDKSIIKKWYSSEYDYKFDKETNLVPKKINRLICIMFSEDRGCHFLYRKFDKKNDSFHFRKGLYIIDNESIHVTKNGNRVCFYLEGISTPIKMDNIERKVEKMQYIDLNGNKQTSVIQKIKGLKFDSKILDIFTDRKLAENFTQGDKAKNILMIILIISIVCLIVACVGCGITYYYR